MNGSEQLNEERADEMRTIGTTKGTKYTKEERTHRNEKRTDPPRPALEVTGSSDAFFGFCSLSALVPFVSFVVVARLSVLHTKYSVLFLHSWRSP